MSTFCTFQTAEFTIINQSFHRISLRCTQCNSSFGRLAGNQQSFVEEGDLEGKPHCVPPDDKARPSIGSLTRPRQRIATLLPPIFLFARSRTPSAVWINPSRLKPISRQTMLCANVSGLPMA